MGVSDTNFCIRLRRLKNGYIESPAAIEDTQLQVDHREEIRPGDFYADGIRSTDPVKKWRTAKRALCSK